MIDASLCRTMRAGLGLLLVAGLAAVGPISEAAALPQQSKGTDKSDTKAKKQPQTVRISTPTGTVIIRSDALPWRASTRRVTKVSNSRSKPTAIDTRVEAEKADTKARPFKIHAGSRSQQFQQGRKALGSASSPAGVMISHPTLGRIELPSDAQLPAGSSGGRSGGKNGGGNGAGISDGNGSMGAVGGDDAGEWRAGRGWVPGGEDDDNGSYLSEPAFARLYPGDGWGGSTSQPDPLGDESMPNWNAQAIARWDVVPYQTIEGDFHIGVVAFHANGIDRVDFSVNGGPWVPVYDMQLNPDTGVWEYAAVVNPAYFDEAGLCEIRAVVWPNDAGIPRVLAGDIVAESLDIGEHSMFLRIPGLGERIDRHFVSPSGSDEDGTGTKANPYRTIETAIASANNANAAIEVQLLPGTHSFGADISLPLLNEGWVIIEPAPGVSREEVTLTGRYPSQASGNRLRTSNICLRDLIIDQSPGWQITAFTHLDGLFWADQCEFIGAGDAINCAPFAWQHWDGMFITDCEVSEYANAVRGAILVRDAHLEQIGSDAFSDSRAVFNSTVSELTRGDGNMHGDVFQIQGVGHTKENFILYGVSAYDVRVQGLFTSSLAQLNDVAFVNVLIDRDVWDDFNELSAPYSQWMSPTNHLLLWNTTFINQAFRFRDHTLQNLSVRGTMFQKVVAEEGIDLESQGLWEHNHYLDAESYGAQAPGEDVTAGPINFQDVGRNMLRPLPGQRLEGRVDPSASLIDLEGLPRPATSSIGAFEVDPIAR